MKVFFTRSTARQGSEQSKNKSKDEDGKGKERKLTSGGSGDTYSRTDKAKGRGVGKNKFTTRGTTKQTIRGPKVSGMKTKDTYGRKKPFMATYRRG